MLCPLSKDTQTYKPISGNHFSDKNSEIGKLDTNATLSLTVKEKRKYKRKIQLPQKKKKN